MNRWLVSTLAFLSGCATAAPEIAPAAPPPPLTATGALVRLTSDPADERYPSLSPDGKVLLFAAGRYENVWNPVETKIVGINPASPTARTIYTPNSTAVGSAAWLPDGTTFLYNTTAPGQWTLVRALSSTPSAGMTVVVGGQQAQGPCSPSVSPDGKRVAFQTLVNGTWNLATVGVDGNSLTFLGDGNNPSWNPKSNRIAFVRNAGGHDHLFVINDDGTALTQLTTEPVSDDFPSWSPDGAMLTFSSNRGWNSHPGRLEAFQNIFAIKPDGTGVTQLTEGGGSAWDPFWGADGWIYFMYYDPSGTTANDIWRLHPPEGLVQLGAAK